MAPNLHAIGDDFNLTDDGEGWSNIDLVLGGYLPLFFFALGTPISLFIGPIIDKSHRRNLFVLLIFVAEIPCFLTFFVTEVWQLLLCRAITGISMAGAEPLIYSIMSDMYGKKERTVMASIISIGAGAGLLAGQALAGFMGPVVGWRYPFLVVSLPSMAFASLVRLYSLLLLSLPLRSCHPPEHLLTSHCFPIYILLQVMFIVEEPVRGSREEALDNVKEDGGSAVYDGSITCAKVCAIVKVCCYPSMRAFCPCWPYFGCEAHGSNVITDCRWAPTCACIWPNFPTLWGGEFCSRTFILACCRALLRIDERRL